MPKHHTHVDSSFGANATFLESPKLNWVGKAGRKQGMKEGKGGPLFCVEPRKCGFSYFFLACSAESRALESPPHTVRAGGKRSWWVGVGDLSGKKINRRI